MAMQATQGRRAGGSNRRQATRVLRCWYCSREHPGGYSSCRKRAQEMPNWQPTQRTMWGANGLMASPREGEAAIFLAGPTRQRDGRRTDTKGVSEARNEHSREQ